MRVSVLLPYLNAAPWLEACLFSLQQQSYPDVEFILVNDHSSDDSELIARQFAATDLRFRLFRNQGKGLVEANATALACASGALITRMDADDLMPFHKIAALAHPLLQHGPGHLSTGYVQFFPDAHIGPGTRFYETWLNTRCDANDHWDWIWRECVIPSPCWMAWKTDVQAVQAFNENIYPDDYELAFRFLQAGLKVIPVTEVLHFWRQHASRMSRKHGGFSAEAFTRLKWSWFQRLYADRLQQLFVLGHGKKARFLTGLLADEKIPFTGIQQWDKISRSYLHLPARTTPDSLIISTLSSIDDYGRTYAALEAGGWSMHRDILRWC